MSPPAVALRTENLTKRYGRVLALDSLDLTVGAGQVFGFLGPNGAGKSTTIRLVLGLARPTSGRAWVFDTPAADVAGVPGVSSLDCDRVDGRTRLRFALSGPPTAVLRALAPAEIESLRLREPGPEEIFLGYYGDGHRGDRRATR